MIYARNTQTYTLSVHVCTQIPVSKTIVVSGSCMYMIMYMYRYISPPLPPSPPPSPFRRAARRVTRWCVKCVCRGRARCLDFCENMYMYMYTCVCVCMYMYVCVYIYIYMMCIHTITHV